MLLVDYHLVFIVICFILLLISILLIFVENSKEGIIAAALFCTLNWVLCLINYLAFFGVGIVGYKSDGTVDVTIYSDMYPLYILFYILLWFNVLLIFVCWFKWSRATLDLEEGNKKTNSYF